MPVSTVQGPKPVQRTPDPWRKTVRVENPYAKFQHDNWEWRVLKAYQSPEQERKNPNARWFCAVKSPHTGNSWEYGDTYIRNIPGAVPGYRGEEAAA